jgi:hypothetical protein
MTDNRVMQGARLLATGAMKFCAGDDLGGKRSAIQKRIAEAK